MKIFLTLFVLFLSNASIAHHNSSHPTIYILDYTGGTSTKEIPCEMETIKSFWSGKTYQCIYNRSSDDIIKFWGNPETEEVVKIERYVLVKSTDLWEVINKFKSHYGEPTEWIPETSPLVYGNKFVWGDSYFDKKSIPGTAIITNNKTHGLGLSLVTELCDNIFGGTYCNEFSVENDTRYTAIHLMLWDTDRWTEADRIYRGIKKIEKIDKETKDSNSLDM